MSSDGVTYSAQMEVGRQGDAPLDGSPASRSVEERFDCVAIETYLTERRLSKRRRPCNVRSIMRVLRKLIPGRGVAHKNKSDVFLEGHCVTPQDDLKAILAWSKEWLPKLVPKSKSFGRKPRVTYALKHPIQKLIDYKNRSAPPRSTSRERAARAQGG